MKVVAIIQARMGSTRFPGKNMVKFNGKPNMQQMVERIKMAKNVDEVIIAQPNEGRKGKELTDFCLNVLKIPVFLGSLNDVYGRVLKAAEKSKADIIVDMTADCPLVDPVHIEFLVDEIKSGKCNYASNIVKRTWPDGFDVQVYTKDLYAYTDKFVTKPKHRFHTGWNIIDKLHIMRIHKEIKIISYEALAKYRYPHWGLTVDEFDDYILIEKIFKHFEDIGFGNKFSAAQVITYLINNEHLLKINKNILRKTPGEG